MQAPFRSYLKNRAYQDLFAETLPCCLRAQDRNATLHGVEPILPFLDHRLAEFMFRVPGDLKIRDGVTKRLLRTAMRDVLPEETRTRIKKTGWNAPAHLWFAGAGRERVLDIVHSQTFRDHGVYDVAAVERIVNEHDEIVRSGRAEENHMMFLWQLVNVDAWLRLVNR
jgi:asparagine synthase (glutamine-hydrolysing)